MDLVDEQEVCGGEVGQDADQIRGAHQRGAARLVNLGAARAGEDARERRLAQARRSAEQNVVESFVATTGRLQRQMDIVEHPLLADELVEANRAQGDVEELFVLLGRGAEGGRVEGGHRSHESADSTSPRGLLPEDPRWPGDSDAAGTLPPAMQKDAATIQSMFAQIAPRYDVLNRVLSCNIDQRWRRKTAALASPAGPILDVCTGTGDLAAAFHAKTGEPVVGVDFCQPMLALGKGKNVGLRPLRCGFGRLRDSQCRRPRPGPAGVGPGRTPRRAHRRARVHDAEESRPGRALSSLLRARAALPRKSRVANPRV
jgi:hypothetical protein